MTSSTYVPVNEYIIENPDGSLDVDLEKCNSVGSNCLTGMVVNFFMEKSLNEISKVENGLIVRLHHFDKLPKKSPIGNIAAFVSDIIYNTAHRNWKIEIVDFS